MFCAQWPASDRAWLASIAPEYFGEYDEEVV
jgi:hypothetical protein